MSYNPYLSATSSFDDYEFDRSRRSALEEQNRRVNEMMRRQMNAVQQRLYEEAGFGLSALQKHSVAGNYVTTPQNRKVLLLCGKI